MVSVFRSMQFYQVILSNSLLRLLDWDIDLFAFLSLKQGIQRLFAEKHDWNQVFERVEKRMLSNVPFVFADIKNSVLNLSTTAGLRPSAAEERIRPLQSLSYLEFSGHFNTEEI